MNHHGLLDLRNRVCELATACRTVDTFFAEGAAQLRQEDEAKTLKTMTAWVFEHVATAKQVEYEAQREWKTDTSFKSFGKYIVKNIDYIDGPHAGLDAFKKNIAALPFGKQPCFGTIVVGVDRRGLPDDVHVISISGRAREQYLPESKIIQALQRQGMLLFYPAVFHSMVDALIKQLLEGKLRLPILPKQLPAQLAVPRKITVKLLPPVQWVAQLPSPKVTDIGDGDSVPSDPI